MQLLEKSYASTVTKKIQSVSKNEIRCILLGVQGLIDWQDDGGHWSHVHGEACFEYALSRIDPPEGPFDVLPGEMAVKTRDFGTVDAVWYGSEGAQKILRIIQECGLNPYELFCPYTSDHQLLPHVRYSFASRSYPDQSHATLPESSDVKTDLDNHQFQDEATGSVALEIGAGPSRDDADIELSPESIEQLLPLLNNADVESRQFRITRWRDVVGKLHRQIVNRLPSLDAKTTANQEPLVWIFEVIVHDLAHAAIRAIERLASENRAEENASLQSPCEPDDASRYSSEAQAAGRGTGGLTKASYRWPREYDQDRWIYDNIAKHTYKKLTKLHETEAEKAGWKMIESRGGFKNRAKRFAEFHGFRARSFNGEEG